MAYNYLIHIQKHRIWGWPRLEGTSAVCLDPSPAERLLKAVSFQVFINSKDKDSRVSWVTCSSV